MVPHGVTVDKDLIYRYVDSTPCADLGYHITHRHHRITARHLGNLLMTHNRQYSNSGNSNILVNRVITRANGLYTGRRAERGFTSLFTKGYSRRVQNTGFGGLQRCNKHVGAALGTDYRNVNEIFLQQRAYTGR